MADAATRSPFAAPASPWKRAVARAFGRAEAYDDAARVQAEAARALVAAIAAAPPRPHPRVLEFGCGTGLLTAALWDRLAPGALLATDIAPAMVARCRARFAGAPGLSFAAMDAERPAVAPGFDLVASNLAAQWFESLPAALAGLTGLLRPGGLLALTTLADGTFREWDRARAAAGLPGAGLAYPAPAALAALRLPGCTLAVTVVDLRETHADAAAFLRALRAIGADTPTAEATPSPGGLRRAMRAFEAQGGQVTYRVATLLARRTVSGGR